MSRNSRRSGNINYQDNLDVSPMYPNENLLGMTGFSKGKPPFEKTQTSFNEQDAEK